MFTTSQHGTTALFFPFQDNQGAHSLTPTFLTFSRNVRLNSLLAFPSTASPSFGFLKTSLKNNDEAWKVHPAHEVFPPTVQYLVGQLY